LCTNTPFIYSLMPGLHKSSNALALRVCVLIHTCQFQFIFNVPSFSVPWFMVTGVLTGLFLFLKTNLALRGLPNILTYASFVFRANHTLVQMQISRMKTTTFRKWCSSISFPSSPISNHCSPMAQLSPILWEHCRICSRSLPQPIAVPPRGGSAWSWYWHVAVTRPWLALKLHLQPAPRGRVPGHSPPSIKKILQLNQMPGLAPVGQTPPVATARANRATHRITQHLRLRTAKQHGHPGTPPPYPLHLPTWLFI